MNPVLAIIGGSGLARLPGLEIVHHEAVATPFGPPSADLAFGIWHGQAVVFLPRHGAQHAIPPHKINYRANIWALARSNVRRVVGVAAVGGIGSLYGPGVLSVPNQLIDYSWGREQTFFDGQSQDSAFDAVKHIDFTWPYCAELRKALLSASRGLSFEVIDGGVYGVTQGPRLETPAEIKRMAQDGCDLVGMTGMPEAALASELDLCYASIAMTVNWAAGITDEAIAMAQIDQELKQSVQRVGQVLAALLQDANTN